MRTGLGNTVHGEVDAVVVGSGPNGLAAAIALAGAGLRVRVYEAADTPGGGARTAELTLPGWRHDVCSAAHPMALASPFFRAFDLAAHGVRMLDPAVAYAHPLDGGRAGLAWRDLERTADGLGEDGAAWRSLFGPLASQWSEFTEVLLSDLRHVPHPAMAARIARRALRLATPLRSGVFAGDLAPALFAGVAAHVFNPPVTPVAAGTGLLLGTLAHAVGWPIPAGGSGRIVDALVAELHARGGEIVLGHRVRSLDELPRTKAVLLDVSPAVLLDVAGGQLPGGYARALRRFRYGAAAAKVDFALSGPVPWAAPGCAEAGTLHLVGSPDEAVAAERTVQSGKHAERPYVLAVQPSTVDPERAPAGGHTFYTYAHVPHGSSVDVTEVVTRQVERFAPGFRDLVLASTASSAVAHERDNANYVGGDISGGALTPWQLAFRPVPRIDPYRTPIDGVYLCSSSTPPGPGVHGMCGVHAAGRALRRVFGIATDPLRLVAGGYPECIPARSPRQPKTIDAR